PHARRGLRGAARLGRRREAGRGSLARGAPAGGTMSDVVDLRGDEPEPSDDRLTEAAVVSPEDHELDIALRPRSLAEFVGQDRVKEQLALLLQAARERGEPLDHLLLSGPPGLGKTTLAQILAHEMGVELHSTNGPVVEHKGALAGLLTKLGRNDILFIDEIHRLNAVVEESLYPAMEDFR